MTPTQLPGKFDPRIAAAVEAEIAAGRGRVFRFEAEGVSGWVKQAVPSKRRLGHRAQAALARLLPLPILRPTVSDGGSKGLFDEVMRNRALHARGIPVPDIIALSPQWVLLGDLGPTLRSIMDSRPERRTELLGRAARTLADLHARGGWHGRGFISDFTLTNDDEIGFIDFEESVEDVMPLVARQARDVWLLSMSAVRYVAADPDLPRLALEAYRDAGGVAEVWQELRRVSRTLRLPRRALEPFAAKLGRDVYQTVRGLEIMERFLADETP